jgi:hypothetical protein
MDNETCCSMVFSCILNFQNIWQQFFPPVLASVSSIIPDLASKLIDFMFLFIYIYILDSLVYLADPLIFLGFLLLFVLCIVMKLDLRIGSNCHVDFV